MVSLDVLECLGPGVISRVQGLGFRIISRLQTISL